MALNTKICSVCGAERLATRDYFDINLRTKDRLKPYCRRCSLYVAAERRKRKREKSREWARNNREKVRESSRKSYQNTKNARKAYLRRWRQANQEHIRKYAQEYRKRKAASAV